MPVMTRTVIEQIAACWTDEEKLDALHRALSPLQNRDEMIQLKQQYLCELADCGEFAEVVGRDYDAPSWGDLADADEIVPDDVILRRYF